MRSFSEYIAERNYQNFYLDWQDMRNNYPEFFSEWDGFERYGLKDAGTSILKGIKTAGKDLYDAASAGMSKIVKIGMQKANEIMKIGLDKLQNYLESKGLGWLLPKLKEYKKPLLILGVIIAGGIAAYVAHNAITPETAQHYFGISVEQWNSMDSQVKDAILNGHQAIKNAEQILKTLPK